MQSMIKPPTATYYLLIVCITAVRAGNLALRQPSYLSSVFQNDRHSLYAVDGNPQGDQLKCAVSQHEDNPYWIVDLGRTYIIDEVHVTGRTDCCQDRIFGGEIRIGDKFDKGGASNPKCADISSFSGRLNKTFKCIPGLRGRYVSFNLPITNGELSLCEIMVNPNPTANIALKKPASQSSLENSKGPASHAVDGVPDGNYDNMHCTHTKEENNPWWRVDLGSSKPISEVFIVNRRIGRDRLTNIEIRVGDSLSDNGNSNPRCGGIYTMATLYKKSFYCKPRKTGRYVNIRLVSMGTRLILTLCEVEVYSESKAVITGNETGITVSQGPPLTLTCPDVFGYPEPYVAWVRDGIVHQNTTTTAVFKGSALEEKRNESHWECIVSNIHGSDLRKFYFKGHWHRMCAKNREVLAARRTVGYGIKSANEASSDNSINESLWFRLKHSSNHQPMQIPESCTPSMHCSTQATGWMLGSHPRVQDGIVRRTVCFNWNGDCCRYNTTILVRNCYGFYVYKLQKTSFDVKAGYCAEISKQGNQDVMFTRVTTENGSNYVLENHVINTERDLDLYQCIAVCLSHHECKSVNHDESTRLCEINNAKRADVSASDWRNQQGYTHYERIELLVFTT